MADAQWMSVRECARYMGWEGEGTGTGPHPQTVSRWCAARVLRATQVTVPRGTYRIARVDADAFMRAHRTSPDRRPA
ncbi:hypothetical protein [Gordonia sp. (in: high G+C Gram-positive bacteria)]|jgi:hypothetical protein|uniref:hypothetical protein n=1 Tax=Gordonia sp. (in: high G+C Gram-positive bacteria) TaxID=84139 RepID=UPI001DF104BF|nr:hypothetical protein [Gordonia sp. (in: high G+C Gram-positive bacteria)]MCB1297077.1 hypothetical protein [Gordonia sp. (in: high G+C Gram-positive bacteria)]HMS74157.1 hypothetical protein [Gordonia sp. (in: high G+C Gram-positive bacteria)]HQV17374.1 hypothetical protein [Gordonia sp. (in: high G+C Gram-positive bacteria)]